MAAESGNCDEGQILGVRPEQNARIVICSEADRKIPQLEAQVARLSAVIDGGGQSAADIRRFVGGLNATARVVPDRSDQLVRSFSQLVQNYSTANDKQIARGFGILALQLEELNDKISERSRDPRTAAQLRNSLNGAAGEAIGRLDVDTAARMLDALDGIKRQLSTVENKVDTANAKLGQLQQDTVCSTATAQLLVLALKSQNAEEAAKFLRCHPELLADRGVKDAIVPLFGASQFYRSRNLLDALSAASVNYMSDLWYHDRYGLIGYPYQITPIGAALSSALDGGLVIDLRFPSSAPPDPMPLDWLVGKASKSDFEAYPYLAQMLAYRMVEITNFRWKARYGLASWATDLSTIKTLKRSGMSVIADNYAAYSAVYRQLVAESWSLPPELGVYQSESINDSPRGSDPNIFDPRWAEPLSVLATEFVPPSRQIRQTLNLAEIDAFSKPRLHALDEQIRRYQGALDRPIVDAKFVGDAFSGHWVDITANPARLRDDDAIQLDPNNARDHFLVKAIRSKLEDYRRARAALEEAGARLRAESQGS
jgi:hypothetical protein